MFISGKFEPLWQVQDESWGIMELMMLQKKVLITLIIWEVYLAI